MWFAADSLALTVAQAACVALPAAGLPAWTERLRSGAWALVLPVSIVSVVAAIAAVPATADVLTWVALLLVPPGAALALGWAARGARPWAALLAAPLLALAWASPDTRAGQLAGTLLIVGSAVTLGRLLAGAAPLSLLKAGVLAMAALDAYLVFSGRLQAPNAVLVAASPGAGLPQLQSAAFGLAGMGYGDFFTAAVVGGILAVERGPQLAAAAALVAVGMCWDQLFAFYDVLPATIPPAVVLVGAEAWRRHRAANARSTAPTAAARTMRAAVSRVVVITGPSGVGKGTLIRLLREQLPELGLSISATTRDPRPGEEDGVAYHFLGDAEFDRLVAGGAFLEHAEYAGRRYGTLRSELERRTAAGEPVVLEIEVQGARQVRDAIPSALLVFIAPPSQEALRERLVGRGTDDPAVVERRLGVAEEELRARHEFAHEVVNDRLEDAVRELVSVVRAGLGGPVDSGA
jgi:guanylate kinase